MAKQRHNKSNPNYDPNMLIILLLILNAYSRKPIYYIDKELLENQHNSVFGKNTEKASDVSYTGSVLSKKNDSQDEAVSNTDYKNIVGEEIEEIEEIEKIEKIESEIVQEYPNRLIMPVEDFQEVIINVPVVLSQFEIEFICEAVINFACEVEDIKSVKQNIYLNECRLIPKANKLFIGGSIRKSIEYLSHNNIKNVSAEIPFKCTTEIKYFTPPVINNMIDQIEVETLRYDGTGIDLFEKSYASSECFNEKIYCKLVSDEIKQISISGEEIKEKDKEKCKDKFETLTDKMVVKLNLKLIQERQVSINKQI